jgi:hypothetical protein
VRLAAFAQVSLSVMVRLKISCGWADRRTGVRIQTKITEALELISEFRPGLSEARLAFGRDHIQRMRVEELLEISRGIGFRHRKQPVV